MGRRKTPTETRKLEGTFRPDRHAGDEIPVCEISPPWELSESAMVHFIRLSSTLKRQRLCTEIDAENVALMAESLTDYLDMRAKVDEHGAVAISSKGVEFLSPYYNAMSAAWKRFVHLSGKFGKTPVDRAGVDCGEDSGESIIDKMLQRSQN